MTVEERFWSKVSPEPNSGCWLWTGCVYGFRHGSFMLNGRARPAHRVSWLLTHGSFPELCVLHRCDVPSCVNPAHLFLGTRTDNAADMYAKGRGLKARGEGHWRAVLTDEDVIRLRSMRREQRLSYPRLAAAFGISTSQASRIVRGEHWKHINAENTGVESNG